MKSPPPKPILFLDMGHSKRDLVVVHTAPSFHAATLLAGLLKSEGVHAVVPGSQLNDEFGSARKLGATDVVVQRVDLELTKDIVAAWEGAPPA